MNILVLNCGSATVKFQIIGAGERRLATGLVEWQGDGARVSFKADGGGALAATEHLADTGAAVDYILHWIASGGGAAAGILSLGDIHAVGHRVVHGGEEFREPARIDDTVIHGIERCAELAPLHNPVNLKGIRAARGLLGEAVAQVAVFDTAFHMTMAPSSYLYGIPYELYEKHRIRRYGFHGTSHQYLAGRYGQIRGLADEAVNIITLHLGGGCSACAVLGGRSVATSMGFTPLAGLLMATRSGDLDPSVVEYIARKEGLGPVEIGHLLNKQSGLLGLSGQSDDMRVLLGLAAAGGNRRAEVAVDIFCGRIRHYVGAYLAEINGAEALVFSGGIGENAPAIRSRVCAGLSWLGVSLDETLNEAMTGGAEGEITTADSRLKVFVIPTNEELLIARQTAALLGGG